MNTRPADADPRLAGRPASGAKSILSADIRLSGDLTSSGTVEVLGEITGDVVAQTLIVGGEGKATGTVRAETLEVRGKLEGKASCVSLTLRAAAQVTAEVNYETLVIESGAQIDGRFAKARTA
jgi:cytoskeletal protein CcmA (bactofilin family)